MGKPESSPKIHLSVCECVCVCVCIFFRRKSALLQITKLMHLTTINTLYTAQLSPGALHKYLWLTKCYYASWKWLLIKPESKETGSLGEPRQGNTKETYAPLNKNKDFSA